MSVMDTLRARLAAGETIIMDGATGTELERRGAVMHDKVWCAMATETAPDTLRAVHEAYIHAGADVIFTNTFSSSLNMLRPAGLEDRFERLNRDAVAIAREARRNAGAEDRVAIAGSVSHQIPVHIGTDRRRTRDGLPDAQEIHDHAAAMIAILLDAGVDLIGLEMMYDPVLAVPTMAAAFEAGVPVWVGLSCRAGDDGQPMAYYDDRIAFEQVLDVLMPAASGAEAIGIMHSSVNVTGRALELIAERSRATLMAYPDSGYFTMPNWQFVDIIAPDALVREARGWSEQGVRIVGGCCGLGLEHIEALAAGLVRSTGGS